MPRVIASIVTSATPEGGPEAGNPSPELPIAVVIRLQQEPGQVFRLPAEADESDRRSVYAAVESRRPLYITVEDGVITNVSLSIIGRVTRFVENPNGSLRVGVDSTARGLLVIPGDPASAILQAAGDRVIMLNVDGKGNIVDARPAPVEAEVFAPSFNDFGLQPRNEIELTTVTLDRVHELFEKLLTARCGVESSRTCLPFDYPDTGCEARAHDMCRRLLASGVVAGKVWVFPPMSVYTRNSELGCHLDWDFHVAPFVSTDATDFVLDPSLFDRPMALDDFIAGMNATSATVGFSTRAVYQVSQGTGRGSRARRDDVSETLSECRRNARKRRPQPPYCPPA